MNKCGPIKSSLITLLAILGIGAPRIAFGQDGQTAAAQMPHVSSPVRVLVITGGHPYEETAFADVFRSIKTISFSEAKLGGEAEQMLKPERSKNYDALVFYDMNQNCEPYLNDLISILEKGKGVVFLHHALGSCAENEEYGYLVGGRARFKPSTAFAAKYKGDTSYRAHIADPSCPITAGISDFDVTDEVYSDYFVNSGAHVFLSTDNAFSGRQLGWTWHFGNSRVVYLQLGHGHKAYENSNYRRLVENSILWASGTPSSRE